MPLERGAPNVYSPTSKCAQAVAAVGQPSSGSLATLDPLKAEGRPGRKSRRTLRSTPEEGQPTRALGVKPPSQTSTPPTVLGASWGRGCSPRGFYGEPCRAGGTVSKLMRLSNNTKQSHQQVRLGDLATLWSAVGKFFLNNKTII